MFDPKTQKYPYPVDTDKHYLEVHMDRGIKFDTNYPYVDQSKGMRFKRAMVRALLHVVVWPVATVRLGLRIKGRENLKKHRDDLKQGAITCANHVHMWDYIGIMKGVRPYNTGLLSWAPNVNGENGTLIRLVGGIPIPENDLAATRKYIKEVSAFIENGGWLHIYPEGSMWEYYAPIRPFKSGVAFFSCKCSRPVLPLGYSYREPGWIRKHIFHQIACFTLNIGEPLFPNPELSGKEQREELTVRCHDAVCRLAGIDPKENLYPPIYDDSKRVDYYATEYGIGYKGSW